jgi:hypothetical protein
MPVATFKSKSAILERQFFLSLRRSFGGLIVFVTILTQTAAMGTLITSQDVTCNPTTGIAGFRVTFDSTPDFFSVDAFGWQATSFQFFINPNPSPTPFDVGTLWRNATTIIRPEEIHVFGDIPIRDRAPTSSDTSSGGWGPIRGSVPFSISGASVIFSVPMDLLGVTGDFSYLLEGYDYGAGIYDFVGTSNAVPESSTHLADALLLVPFAIQLLWKVQHDRQRGVPVPGNVVFTGHRWNGSWKMDLAGLTPSGKDGQ